MRPFLKEMIIDEKQAFCLQNIAQRKKNGRIIESDHITSTVEFNIKIDKRKPVREKMFNFKNTDCKQNLILMISGVAVWVFIQQKYKT